ncbi:hypothetical protein CK203_060845 [Vitis vinifera]|uniref:Uncharacterized protein n=1 Tax=Vitis vinifera TaxID=29760 RepID=A0A438FUA6_VITVI|nr:hypothetical protein CK203_060845 [Vitis vinifera]
MDRLERRIRQMRDPDEMISWDDLDNVLVATLPVGFRMSDIERYTSIGCPLIHLRLYSTVMRALGLDEAQLLTLFPLSLSSVTQRWFARHLTRVPFQDFGSLVQVLFNLDDGISRGLWSDITLFLDTEGRELLDHLRAMEAYVLRTFSIDNLVIIPMRDHCRYPRVISHLYSIVIVIQFSGTLLCILILSRCDLHFSFRIHRLIPRHEQSRPHRRRQRTYSELLSDSDLLMAGHRTNYCASLRHNIQDLIDSGAVSFPVSTIDTDLGPDMTADSFPAYSAHAIPPPSGLYHHTSPIEFHHVGLDRTHYSYYSLRDDDGFDAGVERIELIFSEYPSSSRRAPGVARPSLLHLTSSASVTLGASHPRPPSRFQDPPVIIVPQTWDFWLHWLLGHFQILCLHSFGLTCIDIIDSGTLGHPQSDMFPIPTSAQATHADAPSPAVLDLIDLGN